MTLTELPQRRFAKAALRDLLKPVTQAEDKEIAADAGGSL
jgi:hypothetical protein